MTEREVVLRERRAFFCGAQWRFAEALADAPTRNFRPIDNGIIEDAAAREFTFPTVTRPRVITICSTSFRVVDGRLQWLVSPYTSNGHDGWFDADSNRQVCVCITSELATKLADLIANPTETVPEDA